MTDYSHAARMDRKYRYVRHTYDLTRLGFLFGRNRAIDELRLQERRSVLEIGCGTGRNLTRIARAAPEAEIHGIDISAEMLASCRRKVSRHRNVFLAQADASSFSPEAVFGRKEFDAILMSYSLSMIHEWRRALENALCMLSKGGVLSIVDFGRFESFGIAGKAAVSLLGRFDAPPCIELPQELSRIAERVGDFGLRLSTDLGGFNQFAVAVRK